MKTDTNTTKASAASKSAFQGQGTRRQRDAEARAFIAPAQIERAERLAAASADFELMSIAQVALALGLRQIETEGLEIFGIAPQASLEKIPVSFPAEIVRLIRELATAAKLSATGDEVIVEMIRDMHEDTLNSNRGNGWPDLLVSLYDFEEKEEALARHAMQDVVDRWRSTKAIEGMVGIAAAVISSGKSFTAKQSAETPEL